jgi:hypothetical protein
MAEHHRPQGEQEQADGHDDTAVTGSPFETLLQEPRQTAVARSSSDAGHETQSGSTEARSNSGGAAGMTTAATCQERVPAATGLPATANKQFQNGQALLDGLTAFYKAQGGKAPHIIKCATVATYGKT